MNFLTEAHQIDYLFGNSTGASVTVYNFPNVDMSGYEKAAFYITCPMLAMATATAAANECIVYAAVYTATAATSTALTAVSSATASFGSTSGGQINGARALTVTFNTASVNTTYSICGVQVRVSGTQENSSYGALGGTGLTNATYASALAALINSTQATFYSKYIASTDLPAGATMYSSNAVYIRPRDYGATVMSATGFYGATADKGVRMAGDFQAVIEVPTEKLGGARYITIGINSSQEKTPFYVSLIRSGARYTPGNKGMAVVTKIGSTTT